MSCTPNILSKWEVEKSREQIEAEEQDCGTDVGRL